VSNKEKSKSKTAPFEKPKPEGCATQFKSLAHPPEGPTEGWAPAALDWNVLEESAYGDVNQSVASWLCSVHRDNDLFHNGTHQAPPAFAENHDREFAALQILLMAQIFIGCEQHVKPSVLSGIQQVAVAQCIPPLCSCFLDGMAFQRTGNAPWRSVVEEN
jgi:hypothetical protein